MARPARSPSRRAIAMAFVRTIAAALVVAPEVERAGEPAEQPDAQLGALVAERGGRLLEQLDRALVGDPRAPARVLVADRGAREQLARRPARGRCPPSP